LLLAGSLFAGIASKRHSTGHHVATSGNVVTIAFPLVRPLVSIDFCATALNITPDQTRGLIESGELLWAFNLGLTESRPLVRIWAESLRARIENQPASKAIPDIEVVLKQVFPGAANTVTSSQLSRIWSVDAEHTLNLVRAGLLHLAKGTLCRVGRGGSPALEFASVATFMEERQIV
jgi:hypothetical protein